MATPDLQKYSKSTRKVLAFIALNNGVELWGYRMCKALEVIQGSIKRILIRLEKEELIQSKWKDEPKPPRRLYWCTDPQGVIDYMTEFFPNELKDIPRLK